MRSWARFWLYAVVCTGMVFAVGCEDEQADDPDIGNVKKHRLIAAENRALEQEVADLKAEIASLNEQITKLNADHAAEMDRQKQAIEAVKADRDKWQAKAAEGTKQEVNAVMLGVMQLNEQLKAENEALKAQLEQLKGASDEKEEPSESDPTP